MAGKLHIRTKYDDRKAMWLISGVNHRGENLRPWFNKLAKALVAAQITNFATQGSLAGGWAPLSPNYGLWKAVNEAGRPMMVSSGKLLASVSSTQKLVRQMTGKSMRIGSDVSYAHFHQNGTRKMPQRKVVVLPESVIKVMKRDLAMYVAHGRFKS
jgi:phage gpG-like protein